MAAPEFATHHRSKRLPFDNLFAATKPPSRLSLGSEATRDAPQASVGRLLPSLASMNSLQVREQQETKEEPVRHRMVRKMTGRVAPSDAPDSASEAGLASSSSTAEIVSPVPAMQEAHAMASYSPDMPSGRVGERRNKKGKGYWAAYRKAVRRGLTLPRLPAGERWKRRLPPACR